MRALLLAASVLLVGCGPRLDWTLTVDPSFTGEERAALEHAASAWHDYAPDVNILLVDGPCRAGTDCVVRLDPEGHGWSGVAGVTWPREGMVWLEPGVTEPIARHELGHLLGLGHVEHGVMCVDVEPQWSEDDHAECVRVGVCR